MLWQLDENTYHWLDVIGIWAAALATFLAVIVSPYLANRRPRARLELGADYEGILAGQPRPYAVVRCRNQALHPVTIRNLGWRFGIFQRYRPQIISTQPEYTVIRSGDQLPKKLDAHECAKFLIPMYGGWREAVLKTFGTRFSGHLMRVEIRTADGRRYRARIGKRLRERILNPSDIVIDWDPDAEFDALIDRGGLMK